MASVKIGFSTPQIVGVANGFVHTYAMGTTNPQTTYSDVTGTANTNPVALGSDGLANIFCDDVPHTFVVTDADGNIIRVYDYLYPGVYGNLITSASNQVTSDQSGVNVIDASLTTLESDITSLESDLAGKSSTIHTHTKSDITDLGESFGPNPEGCFMAHSIAWTLGATGTKYMDFVGSEATLLNDTNMVDTYLIPDTDGVKCKVACTVAIIAVNSTRPLNYSANEEAATYELYKNSDLYIGSVPEFAVMRLAVDDKIKIRGYIYEETYRHGAGIVNTLQVCIYIITKPQTSV